MHSPDGGTRSPRSIGTRRGAAVVGSLPVLATATLLLGACGDTTIGSGNSSAELTYAQAMAEICAQTEAGLADLPDPPGEISVADFSEEVARLLGQEADSARRLDAPAEFAADHRAFVANTDEQAAAWIVVALADDEAIGDSTTRIAELTLGRDDLATEMGIPECRRDS